MIHIEDLIYKYRYFLLCFGRNLQLLNLFGGFIPEIYFSLQIKLTFLTLLKSGEYCPEKS